MCDNLPLPPPSSVNSNVSDWLAMLTERAIIHQVGRNITNTGPKRIITIPLVCVTTS